MFTPSSSQGMPVWRWCLALLLVGMAGWSVLHYQPLHLPLPEEMLTINVLSPPAEQKKLADKQQELFRKNCLIQFTLIGTCFGLAALLSASPARFLRQIPSITGGLIFGAICGAAAGAFGVAAREYLNPDVPWPMFSDEVWPLVIETITYSIISILLALPICWGWLIHRSGNLGQEIVRFPTAGVLTGLLLPMTVSILFPAIKTSEFPPVDTVFTGIWMGMLVGGIFLLTTISRSKRTTQ